jgi:putative transposase
MRNLVILFVHVVATLARLLGPGGIRSVVAESVLVKQQLLMLKRSRQRVTPPPNFRSPRRRFVCSPHSPRPPDPFGHRSETFDSLEPPPGLEDRKYRRLFSSQRKGRPGPKGPNKELIEAVVQMKQRNPTWGCPRMAQQIALAFGNPVDKDVVRRILATHYQPKPDAGGPSWLTFLGHLKDSLWSAELFRCESAVLRTHWILVVMDQYTRRIIGFGLHAGAVDGNALCQMFNHAIRGQRSIPKYLSSDNDPLYRFHQWQANLRILGVAEIKTVPYVPLSHPIVECLDRTLFWTTADLESKLLDFKTYFNHHRTHRARAGRPPDDAPTRTVANLQSYRWESHCRGLYQTPIAA